MEFSFDAMLKSEKVKLRRGNKSAILRRPERDDGCMMFSDEPLYAGNEFFVRIDAHDKYVRSSKFFVSPWLCVILSRLRLHVFC